MSNPALLGEAASMARATLPFSVFSLCSPTQEGWDLGVVVLHELRPTQMLRFLGTQSHGASTLCSSQQYSVNDRGRLQP